MFLKPYFLASAVLAALCSMSFGDTSAFTIVDDAALNSAVAQTRTEFMAQRTETQPNFTRLDCTLLIPNPDGTWRRGSFNPTAIAYPASTVKLCFLASAMNWCGTNGQPYTALDADVFPMIKDSDNIATGRVVDSVTGAPNIPGMRKTTDPAWQPWLNARLYTENFLTARGLLENANYFNKTYPSNSGPGLVGAESLGFNNQGSNRMQPKCSASLMLELAKGAIQPGATSYVLDVLKHNRWDGNTITGAGYPAGTIYCNKGGWTSTSNNDVAYVRLPNGKEFILSVFSNAYDGTQPYPYDQSILSVFAEMLMERLGLEAGGPAKVKVDDGGAGYSTTGAWTSSTTAKEKYGATYAFASGGTGNATATFNLNAPTTGKYEICVRYPQGTNRAADAPFTVNHAGGSKTIAVNQQLTGGRWVRLGDFQLNAGSGSVVLSNAVSNQSSIVVADAVRAQLWPAGSPANKVLHIDNITMSNGSVVSDRAYYFAKALVTVKDAAGALVQGANVRCTWTGIASDFQSATTRANGVAEFQGPYSSKQGTSTFNTQEIIMDGGDYNAAANVITSKSIGI
ncbi:MAG: serine hydrolase [Candidatus Sumerlaeaceae bacterium]